MGQNTTRGDEKVRRRSRDRYVEKVDVRLTPEQKRAVEVQAERAGLPVSSWVRMKVLGTLDWSAPPVAGSVTAIEDESGLA